MQQSAAVAISAESAAPPASAVRASVADASIGAPREASPFPVVSAPALTPAPDMPLTEGALAKAPETDAGSAGGPSAETLRQPIISALAAAGHGTAAQLLSAGTWTIDGSNLRIEAPGLGKKMLSLTVNAAAEKVIRTELQRLGGPARFLVVPGVGTVSASSAEPIAAGSVQEAALANPLVQRAKEIFNAEIRSVVDLRQK
jgi:DNA polymerase-3 subunit gamma/tau